MRPQIDGTAAAFRISIRDAPSRRHNNNNNTVRNAIKVLYIRRYYIALCSPLIRPGAATGPRALHNGCGIRHNGGFARRRYNVRASDRFISAIFDVIYTYVCVCFARRRDKMRVMLFEYETPGGICRGGLSGVRVRVCVCVDCNSLRDRVSRGHKLLL